MIANYHTHTWRCKHADGLEQDYIEAAIAAGMQVLGFSDHTPYPFPNGYVSFFRMAPAQASDYFSTLTELKQRYAGKIELHFGVEAEYYPARFDALLELLRQFPCDYMIMGQHFIHNEIDGVYSGRETDDPSVLRQYVTQVLEGLSTGFFTYLAHPDLLHWSGDEITYRRQMERLCQGVKDLGVPLELNLLGLAEGRHYPNECFWEIAGQVGNCAILGCDAHRAADLNRPAIEQLGRELAARHGIALLDRAQLKPLR